MKAFTSIILLSMLSCNSSLKQTNNDYAYGDNLSIINSYSWKYSNDDYGFPPYYYAKPIIVGIHILVPSAKNGILAFELKSGKYQCTISDRSRISSNIVSNRDYVYFGDKDNNLYCYTSYSFTQIWKMQMPGSSAKALCILGNRIYISLYDGKMICIDALTGDVIEKTQIKPFSDIKVLSDNSILAVGENEVYCINTINMKVHNKHTFKNEVNELSGFMKCQYMVSIMSMYENKSYILLSAILGNSPDTIYMCDDQLSEFVKVYESEHIANYSCDESIFVFMENQESLVCYDMTINKLRWKRRIETFGLAAGISNNHVFTYIHPNILAAYNVNTGMLIYRTATMRNVRYIVAEGKTIVAIGNKFEIIGYCVD
jgi:hypothetical protein